jgi:hypothetical protein
MTSKYIVNHIKTLNKFCERLSIVDSSETQHLPKIVHFVIRVPCIRITLTGISVTHCEQNDVTHKQPTY